MIYMITEWTVWNLCRAAFEKEIEGLPTTCFAADLPVELHCPLCKRVMTDAVLTTKCCFGSFCDKCKWALIEWIFYPDIIHGQKVYVLMLHHQIDDLFPWF